MLLCYCAKGMLQHVTDTCKANVACGYSCAFRSTHHKHILHSRWQLSPSCAVIEAEPGNKWRCYNVSLEEMHGCMRVTTFQLGFPQRRVLNMVRKPIIPCLLSVLFLGKANVPKHVAFQDPCKQASSMALLCIYLAC